MRTATCPVTDRYQRELAGTDVIAEGFAELTALGYRYLPRPMLFPKSEMDTFAADTARVVDLVFDLPHRLFDGDLDRFHRSLGADPRRARLLGGAGAAPPPRFGRVDAYHDGDGFKILEFNVGSDVGGQDWVGSVPRALLGIDAFRAFADRNALSYTDTGSLVAELVRGLGAAVTGGRDPVVAMVGLPGDLQYGPGPWQPFQVLLREAGLGGLFCGVTDLRVRDGGVYFGDTRIDVVYRLFQADHVIDDPDAVAVVEHLGRAHADGEIVFFSPMATEAFQNKSCMALLSDPRTRTVLSPDERALVDLILPWTRALDSAALDDRDLVDDCRGRRADLVLKPNSLYGGRGITAGWEVDDAEWWRALRDAAPGGAIVQERVVPRAEPVVNPETGEPEPWEACWGLYYTPAGGYAGGGCRFLPHGSARISDGDRAIPGTSIFDSYRAGVFLYPDEVAT
ncbi:hypothetical protein [Actinokineospora sp. HUAS TT18]|uniref:hypothetical protein n=1 Tax=Actinokineospora sp. HUAS TT18 TaxID=3447451 RepID=UPI003F51E45E